MSCAVYGCINNIQNTSSSILYYNFPKDNLTARRWLDICFWKEDTDFDNAQVCSIHFASDAYSEDFLECIVSKASNVYIKILKSDAIPTLHLPQTATIIKTPGVSDEDKVMVVGINSDITQCIQRTGDKEELLKLDLPLCYESDSSQVEIERLQSESQELQQKLSQQEKSVNRLNKIVARKLCIHNHVNRSLQKFQGILSQHRLSKMGIKDQLNILGKVFSTSQIRFLCHKKSRWSNQDFIAAYTLLHMSNTKFYGYLSRKLQLPLPGISSIKRWLSLAGKGQCTTTQKVEVKSESSDSQ